MRILVILQATTLSMIRILNQLGWLTDMIRRHLCLPSPATQLISSPLPRPEPAVPELLIRRPRHNLRFTRTSFTCCLVWHSACTRLYPHHNRSRPHRQITAGTLALAWYTRPGPDHQILCLLSYTPVSPSSAFRQLCPINEYKTSAHLSNFVFLFPIIGRLPPDLPTPRTILTVTICVRHRF